MFRLAFHLSSYFYGVLQHAPTNRLLARLRTRQGLRWSVPVALALVPVYLFAASIATTVIEDGGPGWLNLLVLLLIWNAIKFAMQALFAAPLGIYRYFRPDAGIRSVPSTATTPGSRDGGTVRPCLRDASIRTEMAPWSS